MQNDKPVRAGAAAASPIPSATILLLRDRGGALEVFMVERHHQIDFATGALVFPGGKLDAGDADPALRAACRGAAGLDDYALALRVAAVRETFEECGVLLARRRGAPELLAAEEVQALGRHREELAAGRRAMLQLVQEEGLELALDMLAPFAHWITPEHMPKRFDTHFYLVAAPAHQARHDGGESVDSTWITPLAAIAAASDKRRTVLFPTLRNLHKLARSASVAAALERARSEAIVTVMPVIGQGASGPVLRIPPEAGYDLHEVPLDPALR